MKFLAHQEKSAVATKYIAAVREAGRSAKASQLSGELRKETTGDTAALNSSAVSPMGTKYSDGFLQNPKEWDLANTLDYGYCNPSGCTSTGSTKYDLWLTLYDYGTPGYGVGLAGTIQKLTGNNVRLTTFTCKTFYEVFPFDQDVHDWPNCPGAVDSSYFGIRQVNYAGWQQGSAPGTQYHLEVTTQFLVSGDSNSHGHVWNSYSYKVETTNSASFVS